MTRRLFLSSAVLLANIPVAVAKPPATKKPVVQKPGTSVPAHYTLTDLCAIADAERIALTEAGSVLLTKETASDVAPTRLWSKGKIISLPVNFVGLAFGGTPGSILGYIRTETGITRAAIYKNGTIRELLPAEDSDNTRAILQSAGTGTVVLTLSSGDCGILEAKASETNEIGRANTGEGASDPFQPLAISSSGTILVGNQGDHGYAWNEGEWNEVRVELDAERTVVCGSNIMGTLFCGYIIIGYPATKRAFIYDTQTDSTETAPMFLPPPFTREAVAYTDIAALAMSSDAVSIVGYVATGRDTETKKKGMLWRGNRAFDLTTRLLPEANGWTITEPQAVNKLGQILAFATNKSEERVILLTPTK